MPILLIAFATSLVTACASTSVETWEPVADDETDLPVRAASTICRIEAGFQPPKNIDKEGYMMSCMGAEGYRPAE